jgi:hypothetical protein
LPRHAQERLEFNVRIAVRAGDWRSASEILINERPHDALFKLFLEVDDVMRKIQVLRYALGVIHIIEGAAAVLRRAFALQFGKAALIPQLHGQTNDWMTLLAEQRSNGGTVHATGHGHGDKAGLRFCTIRQSVKLSFGIHSFSNLLGPDSFYFTGTRMDSHINRPMAPHVRAAISFE